MRQTKGNVFEVILPGTFNEEILFGHLNILTAFLRRILKQGVAPKARKTLLIQ
jgi:hypothetical protein